MTRNQILLALVPPLCFGTGFTIAKPALAHFPPLFLMLMVYAGIAVALSATNRESLKTPWTAIIPISALCVTLQGGLLFHGLSGMPATAANLILQTQVPFAVLLGWLIGGEALESRKIIGTIIALAGVAMVIGLPDRPPPMVPTLLVIGGAFTWSLGQVLARKLSRDSGIGMLKANAYGSVPQLLLATALMERGQWQSLVSAQPIDWAMLLFVGIIGFYVAYMSWYALLRQCRIDEASPFILLMPVIGIATAWLVLGEAVTAAQIAGGAIILSGLMIVSGAGASLMKLAGLAARP